jgi:peptidoglycan biosynthesis protein MviN/MurJ (putative lipid II flippase)
MRNAARENINTFIFHAVASHFVNGLVPVAVLFMLLTLVTADSYFEHTVFHLICVASVAAPVSLLSGIRDWRVKFHGGRAPIFYHKIKLSIFLTILCAAVIAIRTVCHDPIAAGGLIAWLYVGCISLTLPVVVLLGYLGGKLAYMARQKVKNEGSLNPRGT